MPKPDPLLSENAPYQTMIEQVRDYAVFMTDADGFATTWNQGVKNVLGFEEGEFIGQPVAEIIFTEEAQANDVPGWEFRSACKSGSCTDDRWMQRKDGTTFWASGITTAIEDDEGKVIGFSKIMRDLTHRKDADDAIRQLNAELSAADARKSQFLATLAHELRNPLSPITSTMAVIEQRNDLPNDVVEMCSMVSRQVKQLIHLVDDLLDVSRIGRSQIKLNKCHCRFQPIVQQAIEAVQPFIIDSLHSFYMDIQEEPIYLSGDPARLAQVVTNVLNNAAKYTPENGQIWIKLQSEGDKATLSLTDTGIGIGPEKLAQVFDIFVQGDTSSERGKQGLGIGLSLVKTLVELHDGDIDIASDGVGKGTTVTITLPTIGIENVDREKDHERREEEIERLVDSVDDAVEVSIEPLSVLIVDDVYAISFTLSRLIGKLGHLTASAESAAEALRMMEDNCPDVIFSDISMPEMNGYDFAMECRRRFPEKAITMVAMTGHGQAADVERAIAAGFHEHMVKPPDARKLAQFFLRWKRARR